MRKKGGQSGSITTTPRLSKTLNDVREVGHETVEQGVVQDIVKDSRVDEGHRESLTRNLWQKVEGLAQTVEKAMFETIDKRAIKDCRQVLDFILIKRSELENSESGTRSLREEW